MQYIRFLAEVVALILIINIGIILTFVVADIIEKIRKNDEVQK